MNTQDILKTVGLVVVFVLLQVVVVRNLILWDTAFSFIYLLAILLLPGELATTSVILISFVIGLSVDVIYNTAGVHAAACTAIGFFRRNLVRYLFPTKNIENELEITLKEMGGAKFFQYAFIMTFVHHLLLFFIEAGGFSFFLSTLSKVVFSSIFTTLTIFLFSVFLQSLQRSK